MKLFGEMVEEVQGYLRAFVRDQEMSTHLTQDITFAETIIPVANAANLTRGRIQIDDELIWIDTADRQAGTGAVPPYGRGMDGTNKADHAAGTRVVIQPLYPRKVVKDLLNQAITQAGAHLYGLETIELVPNLISFNYELPSYVRDVLNVRVSDAVTVPDVEVVWLRHWTFDKRAPSTVSSTGKALYVPEASFSPTDVITVSVTRDPAALYFDTQLFTESFLPATAWDVVVLTAASRLLTTAQSYFLQGRSVEANTLDSKIDTSAALNQAKLLAQLAAVRMDEERSRLLGDVEERARYSRRATNYSRRTYR